MAQFFNFKEDYFGLKESETEKNTALYGYNIYTKNEKIPEKFSPLRIVLSPAFILMFAAGVLCFFGAGIGTGAAVLLIDFAYAAAEYCFGMASDKRLAEIKESTAIKFRVIRNGKLEFIEKKYIVPEDIIVVQAGERVPADAYILEARELTADESVFTGSNKPVSKYAGAISKSELKPTFVYSGTAILTGVAVCKVSATGVDTKLYQKLGERKNPHGYYTGLEETVGVTIPLCSAVAAVTALISLLLWLFTGNDVVMSALRGITLGLCFLPVGMSTIIRVYYTKGAADLLRKSAVVKSYLDIEKLNSMTVLCVEKEGAISKSRLEVRGIYARSEELLYNVAALACDRNTADPAERALLVKATFFNERFSDIYDENEFIEKIPDGSDFMSGALWNVGGSKLYCIKGTPEQILPLCRLTGDKLYSAQKRYLDYYAKGCSVLAFACADASQGDLDSTAGFAYTFVGFAAFAAPLRESVSAAVKTCRRSGVRVVMLTEDNPAVAEATGKMIGLSGKKAVTGKMISDSVKYGTELDLKADIFARITPEQKLYVIDRLKKSGEVVAMTGTRTEDADSLEMADIGITISQNAAGSSLEAADIIMNDDNFTSVADMIAAARQTHRNIKRAVSVLLSGYIGLIFMNILNVFTSARLMLNPPVLALITMLLLPLAALGYLGCTSDLKTDMPASRFVTSRKTNLPFLAESAIMGALSGAVAIASYMFMYNGNIDFARSCALISYCFATALFAFLRLSPDKPFSAFAASGIPIIVSVAVTALLPVVLVYIPFVNGCFGLEGIGFLPMFICVVTGLLPGILYYFIRHFIKNLNR